MTERILIEGWLTRSRDRTFPPFKSKWIRRYFVLRIEQNLFRLEEFRDEKKKRMRKSIDLSRCEQVDSHLQLSDASCSSRFTLFQWIFSIHLCKNNNSSAEKKSSEVYFVAQSEMEMSDWVTELCRACKLEKQSETGDLGAQPLGYRDLDGVLVRSCVPSSFAGLSSSGRSTESLLDPPLSDVTSEGMTGGRDIYQKNRHGDTRNYHHLRNFRSQPSSNSSRGGGAPLVEEIMMDPMKSNGHGRHASSELVRAPSSVSGCSSVTSRSMTTEDDVTSIHSSHSTAGGGSLIPPVPPRSRLSKHTSQSSITGSAFGTRNRVPDLGRTVPVNGCSLVEEGADNESSGETITLHLPPPQQQSNTHYIVANSDPNPLGSGSGSVSMTSSICSSMAVGPVRGPPPVDRSKKPAKLRLDNEDDRLSAGDNNIYSKYGNCTLTRTPRTPQATPRQNNGNEPPKSAGHLSQHSSRFTDLDYFIPLERAQTATGGRASSHHHIIGSHHLSTTSSHHHHQHNTSDLEYIRIDADKTLAVKQLRANSSRGTVD